MKQKHKVPEPDLEDVRNSLNEHVGYIMNSNAPTTVTQFQPKIIGLSAYLSSVMYPKYGLLYLA